MALTHSINRIDRFIRRASDRFGSIAPLATRIVLGLAFFQAGTGKLRNFDGVVGFFDSLGIPLPAFNAGLVASMETVGGVALIAGLLTRFFAGGLAITMIVALSTADTADFLASWRSASELSPTDVAAFTFLLFLLWLIFYGAGAISLDALLRRALLLRPQPDTESATVPR